MRHRRLRDKLGRNYSLRKATLRDMAKSVLVYQSIITTKPRAKVARRLIDRLITLGKDGSLSARRRAYAILCDHDLVKTLFTEIAPRFERISGGYTRILSLLDRRGDSASQAVLELTQKVVKEKIKREKPAKEVKEEVTPPVAQVSGAEKTPEEKPVPPAVKPKPVIKEKPAVKEKPSAKEERAPEKPKARPEEKPRPKEVEKPKAKAEKPKGKLFGGLGRLFKRQKEF